MSPVEITGRNYSGGEPVPKSLSTGRKMTSNVVMDEKEFTFFVYEVEKSVQWRTPSRQ